MGTWRVFSWCCHKGTRRHPCDVPGPCRGGCACAGSPFLRQRGMLGRHTDPLCVLVVQGLGKSRLLLLCVVQMWSVLENVPVNSRRMCFELLDGICCTLLLRQLEGWCRPSQLASYRFTPHSSITNVKSSL